ncbi:MAG: transglycosylase SLT domain-containing protein [Thermodesulfobacteriota bacterium]
MMPLPPAKKIWAAILSVFCCSFIGINSGFADIYKYIDSNGVLHFTNAPTSSNYMLYIKEQPAIPMQANPTGKYEPIITAASQRHGVSVHLLKAIIKVESDYNPRAVSRKGAKGLMQIMPETIKALNIANVFDPWENIMGGARYFKQLFNRYEGKLPLALAAYNAGPGVVDRFGSIPPFQETEAYVEKVIRYYYIFKRG